MMQLKTIHLKHINTLVLLFISLLVTAQRQKIDGVAVVVGENIVLESDIDKFKQEVELRSEGKITFSDCEMLEQLMTQKLLAHHAVIDSVSVTQQDIDSRVDRSVQFFTQQYGSIDKVIKAYGFNNLNDLKKELSRVQKENVLIEKEQASITDKIDVTPEEVRVYYNKLKESDALPEFSAEVELSQITLYAEPTEDEHKRVIDKLKSIKTDIEENGADFKLKAIINSDDPSVTKNSGNMGLLKKDSPFIKEFKEVAFSLDEGQISEPFKTMFGYHIVKLHKIQGQGRNVSHILIQPEISDLKLSETKQQLDKLKLEIQEGKISFEDAVKKYSEDKETKNNGGIIVNPYTGESTFDLTRIDPALYGRINNLNKGDLSDVFYDETRGGEKMYKLIFVKNKTENHKADLVADYVKVKELALTKKKEEQLDKWSKKKIKETYVKLSKGFDSCDFKADWKKNN